MSVFSFSLNSSTPHICILFTFSLYPSKPHVSICILFFPFPCILLNQIFESSFFLHPVSFKPHILTFTLSFYFPCILLNLIFVSFFYLIVVSFQTTCVHPVFTFSLFPFVHYICIKFLPSSCILLNHISVSSYFLRSVYFKPLFTCTPRILFNYMFESLCRYSVFF